MKTPNGLPVLLLTLAALVYLAVQAPVVVAAAAVLATLAVGT